MAVWRYGCIGGIRSWGMVVLVYEIVKRDLIAWTRLSTPLVLFVVSSAMFLSTPSSRLCIVAKFDTADGEAIDVVGVEQQVFYL